MTVMGSVDRVLPVRKNLSQSDSSAVNYFCLRQLLRDYGAAIGPALAFLLGLLALFVKNAIDRTTARRDAERRLKKIVEIVKISPPPRFYGEMPALSNADDVMTNVTNMRTFFDRLATVQAALEAADKPVHEHGRAGTIIKFHQLRWYLDMMLRERTFFYKMSKGDDVPLEENFANIRSAWEGLLSAADRTANALEYRIGRDIQRVPRTARAADRTPSD